MFLNMHADGACCREAVIQRGLFTSHSPDDREIAGAVYSLDGSSGAVLLLDRGGLDGDLSIGGGGGGCSR